MVFIVINKVNDIDFEREFDNGDINGYYCEKEYHKEPRAYSLL